ncbi:ComF family protein [Rubripirellula reticaptiva]|uniref:DNA utilization protein GntX n=1 Tax=Rubripirellula reticaptiva TaxID=2528013 RepID=A0A5C6FBY2_9BACT|nr:double zinc ribbon domain-containing protein [Rubripirellula reticaptiva]TWU58100.1 DNA utilization protein GntX [Rubripirellula reticaptiva]
MKNLEKSSEPARETHTERNLGLLQDTWVAAKNAVLELILPPVCRLCNAPVRGDDDFCPVCDTALEMSASAMASACRRCGSPQSIVVNRSAPAESVVECQNCRSHSHEFDAVIALWSYNGRVCDAVVAAKYVHNAPLADAMGRRLGQRAAAYFAGSAVPDCVTYVPSHLTRQMTRGGNAIVSVAQSVAKSLNRPSRGLLKLNRAIAKQAWLDDEARQKNVHGAFSVRKSYASPRSPQIANRHILVVDDVLTTGATADAVAGALKQAGAAKVTWAVTARAVRGH